MGFRLAWVPLGLSVFALGLLALDRLAAVESRVAVPLAPQLPAVFGVVTNVSFCLWAAWVVAQATPNSVPPAITFTALDPEQLLVALALLASIPWQRQHTLAAVQRGAYRLCAGGIVAGLLAPPLLGHDLWLPWRAWLAPAFFIALALVAVIAAVAELRQLRDAHHHTERGSHSSS